MVYVDGALLDFADVEVTTFGEDFVRGLSRRFTLPNFPQEGQDTTIRWDQNLQNFVIESVD